MQLTHRPVISATGLFTPRESITNEELVASFNAYVERENARNAAAIATGEVEPLQPSSVEFIEKASGIKSRHVMAKAPILDPDIMAPRWDERGDGDLSIMAENGGRGGSGVNAQRGAGGAGSGPGGRHRTQRAPPRGGGTARLPSPRSRP